MNADMLDIRNQVLMRKQQELEQAMREIQEILDKYQVSFDIDIRLKMNVEDPIGGVNEANKIL